MKRLFRIKYPKVTLLILLSFIAYFIFSQPIIKENLTHLGLAGYIGIFIAGILFSFGFTTPFAIATFIVLNPENIWLAAIIGGIGATISDLVIFKIIRLSFMNEFKALSKTKAGKTISKINVPLSSKIKHYLIYAFAGIIIASPLPDEIGVTMLAGLSHIRALFLAIIGLVFNTIGILIFLSL